jgi:hypothetical protein
VIIVHRLVFRCSVAHTQSAACPSGTWRPGAPSGAKREIGFSVSSSITEKNAWMFCRLPHTSSERSA